MVSLSYKQIAVVEDLLLQIKHAIIDLQTWNEHVSSPDDWLATSEGMKTLAANCMLIEAIGEGFRNIDDRTSQQLLPLRPEIPWREVIGMRNHIAHGYFDINADLVWDVIKNDLSPLLEATIYFYSNLHDIIQVEE